MHIFNGVSYSFAVIMTKPSRSSMSKGVLVGIILGSISCGVTILLAIAFLYTRSNKKSQEKIEKRKPSKFYVYNFCFFNDLGINNRESSCIDS